MNRVGCEVGRIVAGSGIVARFAAIDTECLSIDALCSLATASCLSHFTVAKNRQSRNSNV